MVSIVTINYNGCADTCEMIESLAQHENYPYEIIVVDNASRSNDAEIIQTKHPEVTVISSPKNLGFAGGCNLGTKRAKGNYILYLNNDILIDGPFLKVLVDRINSNPKIGLVSGKILFEHHRDIIQYAGYSEMKMIRIKSHPFGAGETDQRQYDQSCPTGSAHGACMLTSREVIDKAGLMTEIYFLFYEEIDWSLQLRRAGYEIWFEPAAHVYHKEGMSINKGTPLRNYYLARNRVLFSRRNNKGLVLFLSCLYLTVIAYPINVIRSLLSANWANIKAISKGQWEGLTMKKSS